MLRAPRHRVRVRELRLTQPVAAVGGLAADHDARNVHLARKVRRLRDDLPIVARVFDDALAGYLQKTVAGVTILSMSALAAPAFGDATLHAIADREARGPSAT